MFTAEPLSAAFERASAERRKPIERSRRHLMRRYELMLLLRPDLEDDKLQAAVEKVTRSIVNGGGSLSKVSPWGKRRLAYDIGRHREASYFLIHFDIEPSQVREIERGLLITEEILRHLVTVLEDRGPADELAPAVAQRATSELDDADEPFEVDGAAEANVAVEADEVDLAAEPSGEAPGEAIPEPEPEPELVAAEVTGEPADEESAEA
jgi:small subunit ribosomal protein S6